MGRRLESFTRAPVPLPRVAPDVIRLPSPPRLVGYAPGAFDLFHVGHLNLLQRAAAACDHLIAGVVSDDVALAQKGRLPVVSQNQRLSIVAGMRFVDEAYLECNLDKVVSWRTLGFNVVFKGDDWEGTPDGDRLERSFAAVGVRVVYLPYTQHVSTTELRSMVSVRSSA